MLRVYIPSARYGFCNGKTIIFFKIELKLRIFNIIFGRKGFFILRLSYKRLTETYFLENKRTLIIVKLGDSPSGMITLSSKK